MGRKLESLRRFETLSGFLRIQIVRCPASISVSQEILKGQWSTHWQAWGALLHFEFKSDQSKCSDEWDSKGWAKDAHVKLMSLCRSIEVAPYDYDLRKLLKRVWMTASTRLRVRGLLRSDSK